VAAAGQDLIGWTKFLHGKVSVEIASIQRIHCVLSATCRMTGSDWMKAFISQLLRISHSQWIFHNYTLHDKQRGYLHLRLRADILHEVHRMLDTPPSEVPPESQYLLELDHSSMYTASYEDQAYWVLAVKAAHRAGRHAKGRRHRWNRHLHKCRTTPTRNKPRYDFSDLFRQMGYELRTHLPTRKRAHPSIAPAGNACNKWWRKPD
jgi:hypothetical protein